MELKSIVEPLTVTVTEEDIRLGCRNKSTNCPVARAVIRLLGDDEYCSVTSAKVTVRHAVDQMPIREYRVPKNVRQAIMDYDLYRREMEPMTFELTPIG